MSIESISLNQAFDHIRKLDQGVQETTRDKGSVAQVSDSFGQFFGNAVQQLDSSQKVANQGIARLVAGEPVELHQVMLQMEEASINLNLALRVRNKLIEAYQEIQRMQV
jgi:flagellar hook-basal body complex protein FliE